MQCKTSTNILKSGECLCLRKWKHLYSWERITQKIYIPSKIQGTISRWNRWQSDNQMRFLDWLQLIGKILHGNNYLWFVMKKSPVSRMQRFTYFQILCEILERWIRTQHQILLGTKSWVVSKIHHGTELWTQLTESRWKSSGIFSQDSPHFSSSTKSTSSWPKWAIHYNSKDELTSCRCSMTSYGDLKTMKRNVLLIPHLCLYLQKDF